MSKAVWHDLGLLVGTCTQCQADGELRLGELRSPRGIGDLLRGRDSSPPARFVTCGACSWRWTVRHDDTTADGVLARRVPALDRRIPPSGRDWAYPAA